MSNNTRVHKVGDKVKLGKKWYEVVITNKNSVVVLSGSSLLTFNIESIEDIIELEVLNSPLYKLLKEEEQTSE